MEDRVKLALEALKDAREVLDLGGARHVVGTDKAIALITRVDQAIAALSAPEEPSVSGDAIESLARFLNQISQTDIHFDNANKKIQDIYRNKARWILEWQAEQSPHPYDASASGREAGRWVSEDLYWRLYRALDVLKEDGIEGFSYDNGYTTVGDALEALRASTSFPKEGE